MQLTHSLRRAAQLFPRRTSTVFGKRRRNWTETLDRVSRLAGGLVARGLKAGDRVAILGNNSDRYFEAIYALLWAGCVVVPGNTRWAPAEHAYALEDSGPALMIVDADFVGVARQLPGFDPARTIFMGDDAPADLVSIEDLIRNNDPLEDRSASGDAMAFIMYTGGTTGWPKGVMMSHAGMVMAYTSFALVCPYEQDVVFMHCAPMFHIAAVASMLSYTTVGATQVILPRFDPAGRARCGGHRKGQHDAAGADDDRRRRPPPAGASERREQPAQGDLRGFADLRVTAAQSHAEPAERAASTRRTARPRRPAPSWRSAPNSTPSRAPTPGCSAPPAGRRPAPTCASSTS